MASALPLAAAAAPSVAAPAPSATTASAAPASVAFSPAVSASSIAAPAAYASAAAAPAPSVAAFALPTASAAPAPSAAPSPAAFAGPATASATPPAQAAAAGSALSSRDRPSAWAAAEVERAKEYGLIPDDMYGAFLEHMTRAEFCRLAMALYAKITGEPENKSPAPAFADTSDAAILNARELGIVKGTGGGLFMPDSAVTRQEMAVMLYNAIGAIDSAIGKNILQSGSPYALAFRDQASIAPWALQASDALRANEIMVGDEYRRFNPLNNTTKEMAFILVNRVYLVYSGQDAKKTFPPGYSGDIKLLVKGNFLSDGKYAIIGDVHEYYPSIGIADLDDYLAESPHEINGAQYRLDMSESLNESVFAGYSYELDNGHYAIYVFVRGGLPGGERIYLATADGKAYSFYADYEGGAPLTQATFSDVTFTVPGQTAVRVYDANDAGRPAGGNAAAGRGAAAGARTGDGAAGDAGTGIGTGTGAGAGTAAGSGAGAGAGASAGGSAGAGAGSGAGAGTGAVAGAGTAAGAGAGAGTGAGANLTGGDAGVSGASANAGAAQGRDSGAGAGATGGATGAGAAASTGAGSGGASPVAGTGGAGSTGSTGGANAAAAGAGSGAEAGAASPKLTLTYEKLRTGYAHLYDAGLWHISLKNGEV
ncbi:MAG: S-layer homology domain-containing protein, partial [Clostridiales bacterium]|nr:S-layer homology domain-containing protein [Clostridiales bacterium]